MFKACLAHVLKLAWHRAFASFAEAGRFAPTAYELFLEFLGEADAGRVAHRTNGVLFLLVLG